LNLLAADDYDSLFREAAALSSQRNYKDAVHLYEAALKLRPNAPEALNNLAVMYYAAGDYEKAWETASRIVHTQRTFSSAQLIAGLSAIRLSRPAEAIQPLTDLLKHDPGNRDALLGLASAHVAQHQLREAAELYQQQISRAPGDSDAWYGLAICNESMAEAASKRLAEMPGGTSYSKRLLGEFLLARGDQQLADEAFGQSQVSTESSSTEAARQFDEAKALAKASQSAFQHFIDLAPDSWQAHLFLGDLNRQQRRFPESLAEYQNAASAQPHNPAPLLGIGTVYWELGDFDRAEQSLRQALRLNPDSLSAIFELANIAVRRHRDREAIPLLQRYLTAQPDALLARADLGRAYLHLEKFEEAARELKLALDADVQGDIHYQLSIALRKLGRDQEADTAMRASAAIRQAELKREQSLRLKQ
jgi:tetratricopeptide (TPR) repeat protein